MKPTDLYLGATETFSVLIPGMLICLLTAYSLYDFNIIKNTNTSTWLLFLMIAYPVGHILFSVGSAWDEIYNKFNKQDDDSNYYLVQIAKIRSEKDTEHENSSINKYKWSRAVLSTLHTDGYNEVLREEADSKLFRSLILPILVFAIHLYHFDIMASIAGLFVAWLAYRMYRRERTKACLTAYTHVITLHQLGKL